GSAVNQDGASGGLTVPNGRAQEAVIDKAMEMAGIDPSQLSYLEAHGTGTPLGDPIEGRALASALCKGRPKTQPLVIGSVTANIGHLESAAGIAALIKVVLALQHKEIPPHLHFTQPNPRIAWQDLPVTVPTQRIPWETDAAKNDPRVAGISSFSFNGTNV